jgi:nucleoside phosphorylase
MLLIQSGMGAAATERALQWVLLQNPARVVVAGFCGALDDDLEVGDLMQPAEVCDSQRNTWPVGSHHSIGVTGRLVSVERPVLGIAGRYELRARCGAVAVDMESAAAVRLLSECGVPFACLRVVSDDARRGVPEDLATVLDDERISACQLLRAVLHRPTLVADLFCLARQSRLAAQRLAEGVEQMQAAWEGARSASATRTC